MIDQEKYTALLQWHNGIEYFDYNPAIDWALELIKKGIETENVLIIASFSRPVDRDEIKPYISEALNELKLTEKYGEYSIVANAHYYLEQILNDHQLRKNLTKLYQICLNADMDKRLMPFYLLYHGWDELEEIGVNYYFEGADLDNKEKVLKEQAKIWIDKYVYGKEIEVQMERDLKLKNIEASINQSEEIKEKSLWQWVKNIWNK